MKRKNYPSLSSILFLYWFLLRHLFTFLLAISIGLLLLSLYFVSIYGIPNSGITTITTITNQNNHEETLPIFSRQTLISKKLIEYQNNDGVNQQEDDNPWWQWFRSKFNNNNNRDMGEHFNEQQNQQIKLNKSYNHTNLYDNFIGEDYINSQRYTILSQHVDDLTANARRRSRLIRLRFDSLLNKIKINKQDRQQTKCIDSGQVHLPATSLMSKLNYGLQQQTITVKFWTNLTQTLYNLDPCDIVVIEEESDYKKQLSPLINQTFMWPWTRIFHDYFEELSPLLQMPELRCNLFDLVRKYPALKQQPLSPLCFSLPQNLQKFLDVSDALGYSTNWTLEYGNHRYRNHRNHYPHHQKMAGKSRISEPLQVFSQTDRSRLIQINRLALRQQSLYSTTSIFEPILVRQHLIQQVVQYQNQPIKIRIFVLITSLNPLRALQYKHGLVFPYTQNISQLGDSIDNTENLWKYFQDYYPPEKSFQAQKSVHQVLLYALLLLEVSNRLLNLQTRTNSYPPELQSFQWLAFDVIIQHTETFQAFIVDILSAEQLLNHLQMDNVNQHKSIAQMELLDQLQMDTHRLLTRPITRSYEESFQKVRQKLQPLLIEKDNFGLLGVNCHISHRVCLSQSDLEYLIDSVHQFEQIYGQNSSQSLPFEPIYPYEWNSLAELLNIRALFEQILVHVSNNNSNGDGDDDTQQQKQQKGQHFEYQTERLHPVFEAIFTFDINNKSVIFNDQQHQFEAHHDLTNLNWTDDGNINQDSHKQTNPIRMCSNDPYSLSNLKRLEVIYPRSIEIKPKFNPYSMNYGVNKSLDYNQMLIEIEVEVAHCDTWIQLDNHFYNVQAGRLNFSLGLGDNYIRLTLVNRKISESNMVLAIYTIVIHRMSREEQYPRILNNENSNYQICTLIQDCDLQVYPSLPCGWQSTNETFSSEQIWSKKWINLFKDKKICENGAQNGRWLVPCHQCDQERSCLWTEIQWLPFHCQYLIPVEANQLSQCLANKNILLIGDSTNRGIMHYILERLNNTLTEAEKTHNHKTYRLWDYGTTISFAYYPKFWLPPQERPSFAQVFRKSLQTFLDDNTTMTTKNDNIIIIGGVQWISRQHLHLAQKESKSLLKLRGFEDNRIRLIVKTIGSGFHQSVIGVHYMRMNDQIKLASQNQLLIEEALRLNIEVIDTFNKTVALFKDFYPGKCACHFHKITKARTSRDEIHYHVEGQINRLYSEILLSRICT